MPSQSHYAVLGLPPPSSAPDSLILDPVELRRAYRAALLLHHPDKSASSSPAYSVDAILLAYQTLSNPTLRDAYNTRLLGTAAATTAHLHAGDAVPHAEVVDLDDLLESNTICLVHALNFEYHDAERHVVTSECLIRHAWYRQCRCGNPYAYLVPDEILEQTLPDASDEGEVLVQCARCSSWLCVQFSVV
ncbi:uncharacterized protein V1518DRAFT_418569 [Limtongia smithiae]|uniref:uncharacterized protein n=1 Tax=Limtongia smithiae TaxID=1125753 RepID=UPI0034CD54BF